MNTLRKVPAEAVSLALAASVYPPALAAIVALGRGTEVRLRVVLFVAAAYLTVLSTGTLMLFVFKDLDPARQQLVTPSAALYVAGGCVLLLVAGRLRKDRRRSGLKRGSSSRIDRYLRSRSLVFALGFTLYVIPSPLFVGAVKAIADTDASSGERFVYLLQMLTIMLWLIELPMLTLIAFPSRALVVLELTNGWFARHGAEHSRSQAAPSASTW